MQIKHVFFALLVAYTVTEVNQALAETLEKTVLKSLRMHPDMAETIFQLHAKRSNVNSAKGSFLPSVDIIADAGRESIDKDGLPETRLTRKNVRLQLSLPLFHGFANKNELSRASLEMQASYYMSLAEAERLSLQISKAYLDVLRAKEVEIMSLENLEHHSKTNKLVDERHTQGVSDKADLSQVQSRMARARANLLSARNNLRDAETTFVQLVGLNPTHLVRPEISEKYLPNSNSRALELALANNQSLRASHKTMLAAEANADGQNSHYYPKFDLVADRTWKEDVSGVSGKQNEWRVLVQMNWNIFDGGRKNSVHEKAIHEQQAAEVRSNSVYRMVKANVDSSWSSYISLKNELIYLREYVEKTKDTQRLYSQQFKTGRRTLLDLLDSQNELFQARSAYVSADFDYLYSKFRVIASMSYILDAMNINVMKGLHDEG